MNDGAFVLSEDAGDDESRFVVPSNSDDEPLVVELTRLPFPEEAVVVKKDRVYKDATYDPAHPSASAPQSLIRAVAKHLFL